MSAGPRRLYRSEHNRMLAGVCGGLGEYLGIDATLVRLGFVLLAFAGGGVLIYLLMWVIVPRESRLDAPPRDVADDAVNEMRDGIQKGAESVRGAVDRWRSDR